MRVAAGVVSVTRAPASTAMRMSRRSPAQSPGPIVMSCTSCPPSSSPNGRTSATGACTREWARTVRPSRATKRISAPPTATSAEEDITLDPGDHVVEAVAGLQVREDDRFAIADRRRVPAHHAEVRSHVRREIDLVDDEEIAAGHPGTALARHLVAAGHVDHVDADVDELRTERRRQVVATGLEKQDLHVRERRERRVDRLLIDRGVLANRGMRAAARL